MAGSQSLVLEVVTPEGILLNQPVDSVIAQTEGGEVGILKNHANLKSKLNVAPLQYKKSNNKTYEIMAVLGGILEVKNNNITILTDFAELEADINVAEADKAAALAKAKLQTLSESAPASDKELLMTELQLQKQLLLIKSAKLIRK